MIFRPGPVTRIVCGNGGDSGGGCREPFCDPPHGLGDYQHYPNPGDGCGFSWKPADFGIFLQRVSAWQKFNSRSACNALLTDQMRSPFLCAALSRPRSNHCADAADNEIIVEGAGPSSHWTSHLPDTIEAFFQRKGAVFDTIRYHHDNFLRAYGLSAATHPLLAIDVNDWEHPFQKHAP